MTKVRVTRGAIFHPDPAGLVEQRLLNMQAPGHGARSADYLRRYVVGDIISDLSDADAARLVRSGVVEIVPP